MNIIAFQEKEHPSQKRADEYITRYRERGISHFINGSLVSSVSGETFDVKTPINNTSLCTVANGGREEIEIAVRAAQLSFQSWRDTSGLERKTLLHRVADLIEKNGEEIALLETYDTGQPIRFMSKAATRAAENFRFFGDLALSAQDGLTLPSAGHLNYTLRQPIGPVGIITPWNTPFMLSTWKIAPALAAGCSVVHKPAEWSPITAVRLAELIHEAGIPPGVVNLVNGFGETTGRFLTEHPGIKAVGFVGGSETGRIIMKQGAETLKRLHFELGGKNPVIIFADADLDRALDASIFMIYSLNGERCTSGSRLLVDRKIYKSFINRLIQRVKNIKIGNPFNPATELGPLIHPYHLDKVAGYVSTGIKEGATLLAGGRCPNQKLNGNYFEATLFGDASPTMRISREEIFGPFLTVIPFDTEEEAVGIANDVDFGLAAYLWTNNLTRAHNIAHQLEAGMIWINSENVRHLPTPFGGMKASGIGRDGGDYSFDFYMETKNIDIALGKHSVPKLGE